MIPLIHKTDSLPPTLLLSDGHVSARSVYELYDEANVFLLVFI